jgi:transcriptional regulator with XRE-family HTH domain
MPTRASLSQVVGFRFQRIRDKFGIRQDDIATAAQQLGLSWGRSSVAALEQGKRRLSAEELLLLPYVLDAAVRRGNPDAEVALEVSLGELLEPGRKEVLALTDAFGLTAKQVVSWLGEATPDVVPWERKPDVPEAERQAARALTATLGATVTVEAVQEAARRLWVCTLAEERDRRVAETTEGTLSARSLQARRALVTRALLAELAPVVKKES